MRADPLDMIEKLHSMQIGAADLAEQAPYLIVIFS